MTRRSAAPTPSSVAAKTAAAADTLVAWLQTQPRVARDRFPDAAPRVVDPLATAGADAVRAPWASVDAASMNPPTPAAPPAPIDPADVDIPSPNAVALSGAPTATPTRDTTGHEHAAPLRLAHTDWLYHRLSVVGPVAGLADFRATAAGAGTVPWPLDLDRMAEDHFHLLVAPPARTGSLGPPVRSLSLAGSRILADQICAAVARRHALAVGRVGHSRACPFDLHALIPVPDAMLRLGPDDPAALDWLWAHWGTTQPLRHVEAVPPDAALRGRAKAGDATWAVAFWSADWTPWRALAAITGRWPSLRFDMLPSTMRHDQRQYGRRWGKIRRGGGVRLGGSTARRSIGCGAGPGG
jgi:hypothetical protein